MKVLNAAWILSLSLTLAACGNDKMTIEQNNPAEAEQDYSGEFFDKDFTPEREDHGHDQDHSVLTPDEELVINGDFAPFYTFKQTQWNECSESLTGNYETYKCATKRGISVILKEYLNQHLLRCVNEGMKVQGGGVGVQLHVTHAGIMGDARHSPQSMHAEQRAIDVKSIKVKLKNGGETAYTFAKTGNRPFYTALRECWGKTVQNFNKCPLYSGRTMYTGSIGWEDSRHGQHMHLSVPYCMNGKHGAYFWMR